MRDNVSLIFTAIVAVLLLVILPLVSVLERQDNMSYNLVMKLTTSFVDEVRTKGYIDKVSYDNFTQGLSATGNTYDIKMEAHKKIIIKADDYTLIDPKYIEDTLIDYNTDIFNTIESKGNKDVNNKSEVYLLEKGDEFYVKIKNTNTTGATIIYQYLSGNAKQTIININYGGIVNSKSWDTYSEEGETLLKNIEIIISLPRNSNNITPVEPFPPDPFDIDSKPYHYYFNLFEAPLLANPQLTFTVDVKNTTLLNAGPTPIILEGFTATISYLVTPITSDGKYTIVLSNVSIVDSESICKIIVNEGIFNGVDGSTSERTEGSEFTIYKTP